MTKEIIYKFYLHKHEDQYMEYNASEINKDEMDFDIVWNVFPQVPFCVREKYIDWELEYSNVFLLEARRNNPDYISKAKLWTNLKD